MLLHSHKHRPSTYGPANYTAEFGQVIAGLQADPLIDSSKNLNLIGPNLQGTWSPEDIWNTGFITDYSNNLFALAVEQ
jgi:hypothetical protein